MGNYATGGSINDERRVHRNPDFQLPDSLLKLRSDRRCLSLREPHVGVLWEIQVQAFHLIG